MVTRSGGNRVYDLDDRPASTSTWSGTTRRTTPARTRRPSTRSRSRLRSGCWRSAEEGVRMVAGADFQNRSLSMIAEVPQGGLAWFMEGDEESVLGAADEACAEALDASGDRNPLGLMSFDRAARRAVLGDAGRRLPRSGRDRCRAPGGGGERGRAARLPARAPGARPGRARSAAHAALQGEGRAARARDFLGSPEAIALHPSARSAS
jgi:hypothetical protein